MKKKIVKVSRAYKDFRCKICGRMVDHTRVKPFNFETDKTIFKSWDYGHRHANVFRTHGNKQYLMNEIGELPQ